MTDAVCVVILHVKAYTPGAWAKVTLMDDPLERPKTVGPAGAPSPVNVRLPSAALVTLTTAADPYTHAPAPTMTFPYVMTPHRCAALLASPATRLVAGGGAGGKGGEGGGDGGAGGDGVHPFVEFLASESAHAAPSG